VLQNGLLTHPQDLDGPLRVAAQRKINTCGQQYADNQNISPRHSVHIHVVMCFFRNTTDPVRPIQKETQKPDRSKQSYLVQIEFSSWIRFPNERNQGKQAHPMLKYRVSHGSQDSLSLSSSHALSFFSPPSFHTLSLSPAFTTFWWSA
jgi:hypothetical protein